MKKLTDGQRREVLRAVMTDSVLWRIVGGHREW